MKKRIVVLLFGVLLLGGCTWRDVPNFLVDITTPDMYAAALYSEIADAEAADEVEKDPQEPGE